MQIKIIDIIKTRLYFEAGYVAKTIKVEPHNPESYNVYYCLTLTPGMPTESVSVRLSANELLYLRDVLNRIVTEV